MQAATEHAVRTPSVGAPVGDELRRVFVPRFPYYLLFEVSESRLTILAVAHFRRRPRYWERRR